MSKRPGDCGSLVDEQPELNQRNNEKHDEKTRRIATVRTLLSQDANMTFDTNAMKITSVSVNTYMDETKDAVTLQVQMANLPDGTNYSQQTVLDATAKKLQVTTANSNYQKLGYLAGWPLTRLTPRTTLL
jgi:hypothetical protein